MNLANLLYDLARGFGKASSRVRDVETVLTGNPEKIVKRAIRKKIYGKAGGIGRKIARKIK